MASKVLEDLRGTLSYLEACSDHRSDMERAETMMRQAQAKLLEHNERVADIRRAIAILEAAEEKPSDG